jgi:TRAP transporter TAXI family solute receptor
MKSVSDSALNEVRRGFSLLLAAAFFSVACFQNRSAPTAVRQLTISTGTEGGVSALVGNTLATAYTQHIPGVTAQLKSGRSVDESLEDIQSGSADLGFVDSENAYVGYRRGASGSTQPRTNVRAVAVLYPTVVHLFVRRDRHISSVKQFKGLRLMVGERGGYADQAIQLILQSYSLDYENIRPDFTYKPKSHVDLEQNDGVVFYTPFRNRVVVDVVEREDLRLVSIGHEQISAMQASSERNHFLKSTVIPRHTYAGQEDDVLTVGEETLLLCRDDLPDSLVYDLTKVLFDSVPDLIRAHPAAAAINAEHGPTTSVPLHPGAARYYRERELPR